MQLIAHRGIHSDLVRENTIKSIEAVLSSSADGVEVDVRLTKDDVCVVHHNPRTFRRKAISHLTFDELKELDFEILRVEEALEILQPYNGFINLEVKHLYGERGRNRASACIAELTKLIEKAYDHREEAASQIIVSSFSLSNLRVLSTSVPHVQRALLATRVTSFHRIIARALQYGCDAVHVSEHQLRSRHFPAFVQEAHSHGFDVRVYTVNSESDFERARFTGVNAIFTDHVEKMNALR